MTGALPPAGRFVLAGGTIHDPATIVSMFEETPGRSVSSATRSRKALPEELTPLVATSETRLSLAPSLSAVLT